MKKNYNQKGEVLIVKEKGQISQVDVECILYITCKDYISTIVTTNNESHKICRSLSSFEKELSDLGFYKIRRNILLNLNMAKTYKGQPKPVVVVQNGEELQISRRKLHDFLKTFKK